MDIPRWQRRSMQVFFLGDSNIFDRTAAPHSSSQLSLKQFTIVRACTSVPNYTVHCVQVHIRVCIAYAQTCTLNLCAMVGAIAVNLPYSQRWAQGPIDRSSNWAVLRIRIRSDPKLFVRSGSRVRSGKNHSGSRSGQPGPGMKIKQNFSDKIRKSHNISTYSNASSAQLKLKY